MSKPANSSATILIRRPSKVTSDDRGRTVWVAQIEETELELMSSQELKLALLSADAVDRESITALVESGRDGVVARDYATGVFDVISEAELQQMLAHDEAFKSSIGDLDVFVDASPDDDCDGLSLVSTQALRKMLQPEEPEELTVEQMKDNGFDPYDRS